MSRNGKMGGINIMLQKQDMIKNRKLVDYGLGSSLYKLSNSHESWRFWVLKSCKTSVKVGRRSERCFSSFHTYKCPSEQGKCLERKKRWYLVLWEQVSLLTAPPLCKRDPLVEISLYQSWQKQHKVSGNIGSKSLEVRPVNDTWVVVSVPEKALEERKKICKGA